MRIFLCVALALSSLLTPAADGATRTLATELRVQAPDVILADVPFEATITAVDATGEVDAAFTGDVTLENAVVKETSEDAKQTVTIDADGTVTVKLIVAESGGKVIRLTSAGLVGEEEVRVLPGWASLVPPLLAILLAILFRQVVVALLIGVIAGAFILGGYDIFVAFQTTIGKFVIESIADGDRASIIVFSLLLGGMVGVMGRSGGTEGIVTLLTRYAKTRRSSQVATAGLGSAIFFDDYANCLIVGNTMRPLTDRLRVSREKLAYIVDSTAAPVASLVPLSTWVGYQVGLVKDALGALPEGYSTPAYPLILQSIPYMFYPLFALILVFLTAAMGRDGFAMLRAERRASTEGKLVRDGAKPLAAGEGDAGMSAAEDAPRRAFNAFLPILTVVVVTVLGIWVTGRGNSTAEMGALEKLRVIVENANSYQALLWASLAGVMVAVVLAKAQRILTLDESVDAMLAGMKAMLLAMVILVLSWSLGAVTGELHADQFLAQQLADTIGAGWIPFLVFILAAFTAFATGSSWGTMGILIPLVVPLAVSLATNGGMDASGVHVVLLASVASVLGGAVFGDHCSPISDTTVLSSMSTACDHIDHVRTQMPYAVVAAGFATLAGYVPVALGMSIWLTLPIGLVLLFVFVRIVLKEVEPAK